MEQPEFIALLEREAFQEAVTVQRTADGFPDTHAHPFEAKALIIQGQLQISVDGVTQLYRRGEIFHLAANLPHKERYGPDGVTYLVGRNNGPQVCAEQAAHVLQVNCGC